MKKDEKMIVLRNYIQSDAAQLKLYGYADASQKELQALIDTWNQKRFQGNYFEMFAVTDAGAHVGRASLYGRSEHIVSCGIEIFPAFRKKGYGGEAYRNLLTIAKEKGYTIAVAQVRFDNAASIALHRAIGFEAEDYVYRNAKGESVYYFIKNLS